jgi:hypothetical protein
VVVAVFLVLMLVVFLGKVYSYGIINIVKEEKKKHTWGSRRDASRASFVMMLVLVLIVVRGGGHFPCPDAGGVLRQSLFVQNN